MRPTPAKAAFTMVEVLVASMVFALMAVSLLSYVQSGSEIWRRGHQRMSVSSYFRTISQTIQRDLQQADKVVVPALNQTTSAFKYDIPIFKNKAYIGTGTLSLKWISTDRTLLRDLFSVTPTLTIVPTSADETAVNQIGRDRFKFILARDVATFSATRVSSWSVNVAIGIQSSMGGGEELVEGQLATMTFVIPAGR
ncbi:MAG TPA: type II secretion system protein [Candidatus Ozemobacteraceae bacterium]|nr:type II secretion system protein [Candidatus Ozemobacteraceae bacterium]